MSQHRRETDAGVGSRLVWALRRYRPLLALVALLILGATAAAVTLTLRAPVEYSATSSVVASELEHDPSSLPRLAEAVGDEERVLQDAIDSGNLPYSTKELREEHLDLQPLEANVLVLVEVTDPDPDVAVDASNAVATSLAASLNDAGPGVGVFDVLNPATTAEEVSKLVPVTVLLVGGVLATIAAVLAVAGLALVLKRPLTSPDTAATYGARDVLAVVDLGEALSNKSSAAFTGLASVLSERRIDRVVVTGAAHPRLRTLVAEGLVRALHPVNGAAFTPAVRDGAAVVKRLEESEIPVVDRQDLDTHGGPVVVDGVADERSGSTVALPTGASAAVLAVEGRSETGLVAALNRLPYARVAGLVFVRARPRQLRKAARRR